MTYVLGSASAAILDIRFEFSKPPDHLFQSPFHGICAQFLYVLNKIGIFIQPAAGKQHFPESFWDIF